MLNLQDYRFPHRSNRREVPPVSAIISTCCFNNCHQTIVLGTILQRGVKADYVMPCWEGQRNDQDFLVEQVLKSIVKVSTELTKITRWNDRVSAIIWSGASLSSLNASRFHRRTVDTQLHNLQSQACDVQLWISSSY